MRALLALLLLLPGVAFAADGDSCASQGYATMANAAGCIIVCDDADDTGGSPYQCNAGAGFAPPFNYAGGAVHVEIATAPAAGCFVEVFAGASSTRRHFVDVLQCDEATARLVIPAGEHVGGRLYFDVYGGPLDVVAHFERY